MADSISPDPPAYDQHAGWYDAFTGGPLFSELLIPAVFELAGDVQGLRICDLACGQGIIARALASRGAAVVGIDVSRRLLEIAGRYEENAPAAITYLEGDAQRLDIIPDAGFDGVICNMALMDIPDLDATLHEVKRILRPDGWFVCSISHPCFQTPIRRWLVGEDGRHSLEVAAYFEERFWVSDYKEGLRARVGARHRMLSTYLNTAIDAGFTLERMTEPRAGEHMAVEVPGYREVPAALLLRFGTAAPRS